MIQLYTLAAPPQPPLTTNHDPLFLILQQKRRVQTSRFLPDSAFRTYFHKTAFHNYGSANVRPIKGGVSYGHYMSSHSVNPALHPSSDRQVCVSLCARARTCNAQSLSSLTDLF